MPLFITNPLHGSSHYKAFGTKFQWESSLTWQVNNGSSHLTEWYGLRLLQHKTGSYHHLPSFIFLEVNDSFAYCVLNSPRGKNFFMPVRYLYNILRSTIHTLWLKEQGLNAIYFLLGMRPFLYRYLV